MKLCFLGMLYGKEGEQRRQTVKGPPIESSRIASLLVQRTGYGARELCQLMEILEWKSLTQF